MRTVNLEPREIKSLIKALEHCANDPNGYFDHDTDLLQLAENLEELLDTCPHCGSRNTAKISPWLEFECHDCGEEF